MGGTRRCPAPGIPFGHGTVAVTAPGPVLTELVARLTAVPTCVLSGSGHLFLVTIEAFCAKFSSLPAGAVKPLESVTTRPTVTSSRRYVGFSSSSRYAAHSALSRGVSSSEAGDGGIGFRSFRFHPKTWRTWALFPRPARTRSSPSPTGTPLTCALPAIAWYTN